MFTVRGMPDIRVPLIIGLDLAGEVIDVGAGTRGGFMQKRIVITPFRRYATLPAIPPQHR